MGFRVYACGPTGFREPVALLQASGFLGSGCGAAELDPYLHKRTDRGFRVRIPQTPIETAGFYGSRQYVRDE